MSPPRRIQRSRRKDWRMPAGFLYVGRPTLFGNPFPLDLFGHAEAMDLFRQAVHREVDLDLWHHVYAYQEASPDWQHGDEWITAAMIRQCLRGRNLACWCALDVPCHADVLLEIAND